MARVVVLAFREGAQVGVEGDKTIGRAEARGERKQDYHQFWNETGAEKDGGKVAH
jgi:hypothetical protein